MHREVTQAITDAGVTLIITWQPLVYPPQPRVESRNKATEIINVILLERYGMAVASADAITIHRGQMKWDGLHITSESAEILVEKIYGTVRRLKTEPTTRENLKNTFTMTKKLPHGWKCSDRQYYHLHMAAKIIGKGGERITRIKTFYNMEINTRDEDQDRRTFNIKGADKDIPKWLCRWKTWP